MAVVIVNMKPYTLLQQYNNFIVCNDGNCNYSFHIEEIENTDSEQLKDLLHNHQIARVGSR